MSVGFFEMFQICIGVLLSFVWEFASQRVILSVFDVFGHSHVSCCYCWLSLWNSMVMLKKSVAHDLRVAGSVHVGYIYYHQMYYFFSPCSSIVSSKKYWHISRSFSLRNVPLVQPCCTGYYPCCIELSDITPFCISLCSSSLHVIVLSGTYVWYYDPTPSPSAGPNCYI